MRLLLDACVWGGAREELQGAGHDVVWAGGWPENPSDEEILKRADLEGRILASSHPSRRIPFSDQTRRSRSNKPNSLNALSKSMTRRTPSSLTFSLYPCKILLTIRKTADPHSIGEHHELARLHHSRSGHLPRKGLHQRYTDHGIRRS